MDSSRPAYTGRCSCFSPTKADRAKCQAALYFPDIPGRTLSGETTSTTSILQNRISILSILGMRISEEHSQSFVNPVLEDWVNNDALQFVQINHQSNPLKSMLLSVSA